MNVHRPKSSLLQQYILLTHKIFYQILERIKRYVKERDTDIQVGLIEVLDNFWEGGALP